MSDLNKFAEQLVNLSVKEVNELAAILKKDYGIEPAVAGPVMVAVDTGAKAPEAAAAKTSFDVILKKPGASKLAVIKLVKDLAGLNIATAKELVDSAPKAIKEALPKDEAEALKGQLEAAGAEVELQ